MSCSYQWRRVDSRELNADYFKKVDAKLQTSLQSMLARLMEAQLKQSGYYLTINDLEVPASTLVC